MKLKALLLIIFIGILFTIVVNKRVEIAEKNAYQHGYNFRANEERSLYYNDHENFMKHLTGPILIPEKHKGMD